GEGGGGDIVFHLPRGSGARNPHREAGGVFFRFLTKTLDRIRRGGRKGKIQRRAGKIDGDVFPAAKPGPCAGRGGGQCRPYPTAHGGDREVSARHLFPQWRPREPI